MWTWSQEEAVTERPPAHETATGNPVHPVNQTAREVQKLKEKMVTQSSCVSSHNSLYGSSLLDRQGDLRTRT